MPGQPVILGPFASGLNIQSDPSALEDTELVDCVNFEVDLDGSLISRPPVVQHSSSSPNGRMLILGFAMFMGGTCLIGSCPGGLYYFQGSSWTLITSTIRATSMVQFQSKVFIPANPGEGNPGGWWSMDAQGAVAPKTWTPISTMPRGEGITAYKGRLFIVPGLHATSNRSRIYWSGVNPGDSTLDPTIWDTVNDYVDVNPGDGQAGVDILVFNDSLFILKQDSSYVFGFDTSPKQGVIRKVSGTIGAARDHCVVLYENNMYIFHDGWVYEQINYDFNRLNTKVPFFYDPSSPGSFSEEVFCTKFGDRLIVRYYNRIYAFGFRTRTWTRWESNFYFGPLTEYPPALVRAINSPYYAGSCINGNTNILQANNGYDNVMKEEMSCSILTKNYDLESSNRFKRLFYWGADVLSIDSIEGTVTPVVHAWRIPWSTLKTYTWGELQTWGYPLYTPVTTTALVPIGAQSSRVFVKFLRSIRFRQLHFTLKMTTDGSTARGPARIFSLTAFVRLKENVVKAVS
jgi:hypothetical protein